MLSVGGSLIVPEKGIDASFLKGLRDLISRHVRRGRRFILVCGGGAVCRRYLTAARKVSRPEERELDRIGIQSTRLNAHLVRVIFGDLAYRDIVFDPSRRIRTRRPVIVGAGWKPGSSSDLDAVLLAVSYGARTVINLSDIDYVYDKDPGRFPTARPITEMDWRRFSEMFGTGWSPGLHSPFDPVAAVRARKAGLRVIVAQGRDLKNVDAIIRGGRFKGTLISD